jgi:tetratricopeptide (TPR) repeat protein
MAIPLALETPSALSASIVALRQRARSAALCRTASNRDGLKLASQVSGALGATELHAARLRSRQCLFRPLRKKRPAKRLNAMLLSPRDPEVAWWHGELARAEVGLKDYQVAIDEATQAIDGRYRIWVMYSILGSAYALDGNIDAAKPALAEAHRLNPQYTIKWLSSRGFNDPAFLDAIRKAGVPEE